MAADLWRRLDRPNVFIKIPATPAGVPAIEQSIASGINVNVTLMFSVELYDEVARAYIKGLQRFFSGNERMNLARSDSLVKAPVSVASFFVSRVDTLVDKILNEKIAATRDDALRARLESLLGRAAVDNAVIAYQHFKQIFAGAGWEDLAQRGARGPAAAVGEHQHEEPSLQRRDVRRGAGRTGHGQHRAAGNAGGDQGPRSHRTHGRLGGVCGSRRMPPSRH